MNVKKMLCAAVLAASIPAAAEAAITFNVNGTFTSGGTLTGTFMTNDAITLVTGINLLSSANGAFTSMTYADGGTIDNQQLPRTFRLTTTTGGNQVQFFFSPSLTATGGTIGQNSFERQGVAGSRTLIGSVTAAVPEPAAWGMMVVGFGLLGASIRYGRRKTSLSFA